MTGGCVTCICQCKCISNCIVHVYIYVCMHMQEGLANASIDIYESEPTSALTQEGHGV